MSAAGTRDAQARGRSGWLDLWRSLAVWLMLVCHAIYDLVDFGFLPAALRTTPAVEALQALGAGSFLLISGISIRLSRNPLRRSGVTLCGAAAVTVASVLVGKPILFGVLHLLGCCMCFYALGKDKLEQLLSPRIAPALILLFFLTGMVLSRLRTPLPFLFPLGLVSPGFVSWDYFPLLPWGFLFLFGACLGKYATGRLPPLSLSPALSFCGQHSLGIYLLHQPVFYGLLWALRQFLKISSF